MDPSPGSEVLCEGWMVKSPPLETKPHIPGYSLFKAKWRRRWFVLQQGKLPRQYLLNYYQDDTKKKLKGTIALDDCEQVEHGLVDRKGNYDFMFSINTRSRSYFLAVDSRKEMDTWVNMVCKACGLKENVDDVEAAEAENSISQTPSVQNVPIEVAPKKASTVSTSSSNGPPNDRIYQNTLPFQKPDSGLQDPTTSAKPTVSGPYIHISECFSGKPVPPKPPPRQITSSLGSSQQHEKPINRVPSTGSHRHDSSTDEEQIYFYMPSNATIDRNGKTSMIMIPAKNYEHPSLAYIDLDLPKDDEVFTPPSRTATMNKKTSQNFAESETIYKTVDFERTKAFNQTRKDREETRLDTTDHRTS